MGWLKGIRAPQPPADTRVIEIRGPNQEQLVEHIEYINLEPPDHHLRNEIRARTLGVKGLEAGNLASLPFLPAHKVVESATAAATESRQRIWIVVDDIVYDCTDFAHDHPGGYTVVQSFAGKDCSWQFWRFHNAQIMEKEGGPLRIGKTKGVQNPYKEKPRFVGLRKLGNDEW